jgi:hypothetical protein
MSEGLTPDLLFAAACLWVFGMVLTWRRLPLPLAAAITTLKVAIPLVYFAYYAGTWIFLDDIKYQAEGAGMLAAGFTPLSAVTTPAGIIHLGMLAGGEHVLYGWWNLLGLWLFGGHYWSPIFLNVGLTFVAAVYLERTLEELGMEKAYRRWAMAFFLVHWDILAWSSFINLKDTLVMTITSAGILAMVRLAKGASLRKLGALALVALLFTWIRFYLTALMLVALGIWLFFQWRDRRKYLLLAVIGVVVAAAMHARAGDLADVQIAHLPIGLFRTILTPQPWNIDPAYTFLTIPAIANWLTFGLLISGAWAAWRHGGPARLLIIYMLAIVVFYSAVPALEGPRQRFQITPICAWLEFHAFWMLLRARRNRPLETNGVLPASATEGLLEGA